MLSLGSAMTKANDAHLSAKPVGEPEIGRPRRRPTNAAERVVQRVRTERKNTLALVTLVETSQRTNSSGRRGRFGR